MSFRMNFLESYGFKLKSEDIFGITATSKDKPLVVVTGCALAQVLQPGVVLVGDKIADSMVPDWSMLAVEPRRVPLSTLLSQPEDAAPLPPLPPGQVIDPEVMSFMLTGGTTGRPKCVIVHHKMALHEVRTYPQVMHARYALELGTEERVLQHTAALWAASALGQVDIALAFGATMCIAEGVDEPTVHDTAPTILGVVPSSLHALRPGVAATSVRCVFTWGEALPAGLAKQWRDCGMLVLELLISTEYWLSMVGDGGMSASGRSLYHVVPGLQARTPERPQLLSTASSLA
eukprot:1482970-Amphidinium_carterae.1